MFNQDVANAICARLAEGLSLRKACEAEDVKHPTFLLWVSASPELADQYARNKAHGRALRFDALREIAASEPERDDKGRIDPGWVAWKRLHIDAEKWSLSKEEPKKYGEKLELGGELGVTAKIERITRKIVDGTDPRDA